MSDSTTTKMWISRGRERKERKEETEPGTLKEFCAYACQSDSQSRLSYHTLLSRWSLVSIRFMTTGHDSHTEPAQPLMEIPGKMVSMVITSVKLAVVSAWTLRDAVELRVANPQDGPRCYGSMDDWRNDCRWQADLTRVLGLAGWCRYNCVPFSYAGRKGGSDDHSSVLPLWSMDWKEMRIGM